MHYAAQKQLTEPARARAELWRFALGLSLTIACYLALGHTYFTLLAELVTPNEWPALAAEIEQGSSARGMLALLASFGFILLSLTFVMRSLHSRTLASLFGKGRVFWLHGLRVATALTAFSGLLWIVPEPALLAPFQNIDYLRWLALLPLSIPLLLIQVTAEEVLFRGYAQSQLAARFTNPVVWLVLPALVFGLLHYNPSQMGANAWAITLMACLLGLAAGDLTARSGTLAPAIALHIFINASSILYIAPGDVLFGLALYTYPFALSDPSLRSIWLPYDLMILLCAWLTARLAIRR